MRNLLLLLTAMMTGLTAESGPAPEDQDLAEFLAFLAPPPQAPIPFVEQRMSALLERPIEVRGELEIRANGTIEKRILSPVLERVAITSTTVTLERDGKTRTIDLARDPRSRALYEGVAGLLARDATELTRVFAVSLSKTTRDWSLTLEPLTRHRGMEAMRITAFGEGNQLLRLRVQLGQSDWQEMTFLQSSR